jgi:hypothetical protein
VEEEGIREWGIGIREEKRHKPEIKKCLSV